MLFAYLVCIIPIFYCPQELCIPQFFLAYNDYMFVSGRKLMPFTLFLLAFFLLVPVAHFLPHEHNHDVSEVSTSIGHPAFYQKTFFVLPLLALFVLFGILANNTLGTAVSLRLLAYKALFIDDPNKRSLAKGIMHLNGY